MKKYKMPKVKPEIRNAMKSIGFTDYFINLFVTLLNCGEMNAHELSDITQVPYSRIYEILNEMVAKIGENITIKRFARFKIGEE